MRSFIRLPFKIFLPICKLFPTLPKFPILRSAPLIPVLLPVPALSLVQTADRRRQGMASKYGTRAA